jgi:hypothetical protein
VFYIHISICLVLYLCELNLRFGLILFLLFCLIYMHIDRGSFLSITFCFILYMIQYAFSCPFFDVDKGGEIFPT